MNEVIKTPEISVITLVPGNEKFLLPTIRSIYRQAPTFEIILVCPKNHNFQWHYISDVINQYPISKIVDKEDFSPSQGLNNGIEVASGRFILCLNAGDMILPDTFRNVLEITRKTKELDILMGHGLLLDSNLKMKGMIFSKPINKIDLQSNKTSLVHQSTFYSKDFLIHHGGFSEDFVTAYDLEIVARTFESKSAVKISNFFWGCWVYNRESISFSEKFENLRLKELQSISLLIPKIHCFRIKSVFFRCILFLKHPLRPMLRRGYFLNFYAKLRKLQVSYD